MYRADGLVDWQNGWEMIGAFTTIALFGMAWYQIREVRRENRIERTLTACSRYESDATVEQCVRTLRKAFSAGSSDTEICRYQHEAIIVLNFLDTIAIGIDQDVYDDRLARDHMKSIVKKWNDLLLINPINLAALAIEKDDFKSLSCLWGRWNENTLYYGHGLFRRSRTTR
jgi:hypothetical protein